jgi:predicted NBD/HSP70 family sugar kinase
MVCGRGLKELYLQIADEAVDGVTIFQRARDGESNAQRVVELFSRYLGETMQMVSRFYHPGRIIINGSIKRAASDYLERAVEVYRTGLQPSFQTDVFISELEHAAELGTLVGGSRRWAQ